MPVINPVRALTLVFSLSMVACEEVPSPELVADASTRVPPGLDGAVTQIFAPHLPSVPAGNVRVVTGPAPVQPLADALLRAVSAAGRAIEARTDARGLAAMNLPASEGLWSLSVAKRGLAAVSLVGLRGVPEGDIRLDPLIQFGEGGGVALSGTVEGAAPGASVVIDAFNADTMRLMPGQTSFRTSYYLELPTLPLEVVAMEVVGGRAQRITRSAMIARSGMPVSDVAIRFPEGGSGFRTVRVPVNIPAGSIATEGIQRFVPSYVSRTDYGFERTILAVGTSREFYSGPMSAVEFDVSDGDLKPDFAVVVLDGNRVRTNLLVHRFDGSERIDVPTFTALEATGASLGVMEVRSDATGLDALALQLGEDENHAPSWRVFFLPAATGGGARIPQLPGGLTPADIGLSAPTISYGLLAIWMYAGQPWSTPNSNGMVLGYRTTVGTNYADVITTWR